MRDSYNTTSARWIGKDEMGTSGFSTPACCASSGPCEFWLWADILAPMLLFYAASSCTSWSLCSVWGETFIKNVWLSPCSETDVIVGEKLHIVIVCASLSEV